MKFDGCRTPCLESSAGYVWKETKSGSGSCDVLHLALHPVECDQPDRVGVQSEGTHNFADPGRPLDFHGAPAGFTQEKLTENLDLYGHGLP